MNAKLWPKILAVTSTTTDDGTVDIYLCNGTFTLTLAGRARRRNVEVVNIGSGTITVASSVGSVLGVSSLAGQYTSALYAFDGSNWYARASTSGANAFALNGVTAGTAAASKAAILGASGEIDIVKFGAIGSSDSSLGIDGQAAAQGGAIVATGGTSSTATNAGGAVTLKGGAGNTSGAGGAANLTGGVPGVTGVGGAASVAGGAGGATSGKGGAASVTGGAGTAGNADGGSVVLAGGAKNGSGLDGGVFNRATYQFRKQAAPGAGSDQNEVLTAAQLIGGIYVHTVTTGRTLTTPTGANISAGCPADLAVGDSFDFTLITVGTGADDISTLTAGDGNVTFVGVVAVGPNIAGTDTASATWRFRNTGTSTWVGYRLT